MTLAAVARLCRRYLPVVVSQSRLGGARSAALVHETGRLSSPTPHGPLGRLLPCPPHQPGGGLPWAPLLQSQRFLCSGLNNALGSAGAFSPEDHTTAVKDFASIIKFSCHGEAHMASVRELGATAVLLQSNLTVLKKRTNLFMIILLCTAVFSQVLLSLVSRYYETEKSRTIKYKAKLAIVQDENEANKLKKQELKERAVKLLSKGASPDKVTTTTPSSN